MPRFFIFLLTLVSLGSAQIIVPITPAERRILFLVESVRLSSLSGTNIMKRDDVLTMIDNGLDLYFNMDETAKSLLGSNYPKFATNEIREFQYNFRQIVKYSIYLQKDQATGTGDIQLVKDPFIPNPNATATIQFIPKLQTTPVRLSFVFDDQVRYLQDMLLNNDSLMKQYREQFQAILKKNGAKSFLKLLSSKVKELQHKAR